MTLRFGRYEAVGKLGAGAMAAVHLARDPVLDRLVAVKVLHRDVAAGRIPLQRFFNEAKTVARLANPHVVEVFDFGKQGREYYLVMEFVDGLSLRGMLQPTRPEAAAGPLPESPSQGRPGRPLPDDITASLLCQAAEGLDIAARHGVVHRDIKPENLMVNSQGYLKVADFGIAHLQDDSLTRTGAVLGSPLYMSPEQVRGAKPITSQSDMFSLGAVFYRCLTGRPPFASTTLKELFRKIAQEAPEPLARVRPDLDPALIHLVDTLLQKDPSRRGDGPRWFRAELRAWLLARGLSDPMERVGRYLRVSHRDAAPAAWSLYPDAALPRTVMSTSPLALGETAESHAAALAHRDASGPTLAGDALPDPFPEPPERPWARRLGLAGAGFLVAALGIGTLLHFRAGTTPHSEDRMGTGLGGTAVGGLEQDGPITASAGEQPGAGAEWAADPWKGSGPDPRAPDTLDGSARGGGTSGGDGVAGGMGTGSPSVDIRPSDPAAGAGVEANAGTCALLVQSAPPFAQVFLDGNEIGVAPVHITALLPGPHRLLIKGRSGAVLDTVLDVRPGRRLLRVRLVPDRVALENAE